MKKTLSFLMVLAILLSFPQVAFAGEPQGDPNAAQAKTGSSQADLETGAGVQTRYEISNPNLQLVEAPAVPADDPEDPFEAFLRLGKPKPGVLMVIGGVQVWNDAETLFVQFEVDEPYCIVALHLQVANDLSRLPDASTRPGNPAINEGYEDCLPVRGPFEFNISANGWSVGSNLVIAAHVIVGTMVCEDPVDAPYGPFQVIDYEQGLQKSGDPVIVERSNPDAVLIWETVIDDEAFFSLGLGGWIEVEFDNPILNGVGDDVLLVEDTWSTTYPSETAAVYASNDGETWTYLGEADNSERDPVYTWQTVSSFELGDLENARFIRVVDTTPVETMPVNGDGYDINAIEALQDYEGTCEVTDCGTAWAGNKLITGAQWSRWFRYIIK